MHLVYVNLIMDFIRKELEKHSDVLGLTRYVESDKPEKNVIINETLRKLFRELWLLNVTCYITKDGKYGVRIDSDCGIEVSLFFRLNDNALSISICNVKTVIYNDDKKLSSRDATSEESQFFNSFLVKVTDNMKENADVRTLVKCFYAVLLKKGKTKALPNVVTSFYDIYQKGIDHFPQYLALTKEERFAILNTVFLKTGGNANAHTLSKEVFMEFGKNHLIGEVYKYSSIDSDLKKNIKYTFIAIKWKNHKTTYDPNIFYDDEIVWILYGYNTGSGIIKTTFHASELWNLLNYDGIDYDETKTDV